MNIWLPYQLRWLNDDSPIKIWEKSRRIGATYVQSFEDVLDCVKGKTKAVWFSSADDSAAKEYIHYCAHWTKFLNAVAGEVQESIIEDEKNITVYKIQFSNGARINALSSNPKNFRSKGGKVILDEFAYHDDAKAMWDAAVPTTTWGDKLRILSTHNGKNCLYFQFVNEIKTGKKDWSLHTTDIYTAVNEGMADKLMKRQLLTAEERDKWIEQIKSRAGTDITWQQEYCCVPVDEATAFLSYDLIYTCQKEVLQNLEQTVSPLYVGVDIGRKRDLTVITVLEDIAGFLFTRAMIVLDREKFKTQREVLYQILSLPNFRRCCIDSTGIGNQLSEEAQDAFGKTRVEQVNFSANVKERLAYDLLRKFQDKSVFIPFDDKLTADLHSIRKFTTIAGNSRFDSVAEETDGHADRFWSLALGIHAASQNVGSVFAIPGKKLESAQILEGYL